MPGGSGTDIVVNMVTVRGQQVEWNENLTIGQVLKDLGYHFPLLLVRVNEQIVKKKDWDGYHLPDKAIVDIHHVVAGG